MPADILINNYSTENVFLGGLYMEPATYTNSTGSTVTINKGRLMGRILATDKVLPQASASTDGSEMPIGFAGDDYSVADGTTITMWIVTKGKVNENKIGLASGDTLSTAVRSVSTGGGTIRDLIQRNTLCLIVPATELSNYDNN